LIALLSHFDKMQSGKIVWVRFWMDWNWRKKLAGNSLLNQLLVILPFKVQVSFFSLAPTCFVFYDAVIAFYDDEKKTSECDVYSSTNDLY
jgi:hypothetical protein